MNTANFSNIKSTLFKFPATVFFLLYLVSGSTFAEKPIATCVDDHGDLTYTDYLCETSQPENNPHLMTESAINPSVRAKIPSVVRAEAIRSSQLKSVTSEAQNQCKQGFASYFRSKHPTAENISEVAFSNVVDQYMKGKNVSISLSDQVEYVDNSYSIFTNIECTVQKFKASNDWLIGFRER